MKVILPPTHFATGMDVEEQSFTWTVDNFPLIRRHKGMIESQKLDFTAGETTGPISQWTIQLYEKSKDGKRWIWIALYLRSPHPDDSKLKRSHSEFKFTIKDNNGEVIKNSETGPMQVATTFAGFSSWGPKNFIDADDANFCPEDSLEIHVTFKLYTPSKSNSLDAIMKKFQVTFSDQLRKDLSGLRKNPVPGGDIKIISSDKKEFIMQRGILAVRSEVFAAMLSSNMAEANSGVIQLPDISSKTLEILLNFLCSGDLDPSWRHVEVLIELTNAAAKYQLPDLLQFLDATLGMVCRVENVLELFTLAHQLSLKTAEAELSKFISASSISPEDCCKILKGISFPGLDGSVHDHSLSKSKSRFWTLLIRPFKGLVAKN